MMLPPSSPEDLCRQHLTQQGHERARILLRLRDEIVHEAVGSPPPVVSAAFARKDLLWVSVVARPGRVGVTVALFAAAR